MSAIMKRTTIYAPGTPEGITNAMHARPAGVPEDAVIVDVNVTTEQVMTHVMTRVMTHTSLEITLEWPE